MAIEAVPPRRKRDDRRAPIALVRHRQAPAANGRPPRVVTVAPSGDGGGGDGVGSWTCSCICGWATPLRFRQEGAAAHAGELHLRVCTLLNP
jgi:hypothetical protein